MALHGWLIRQHGLRSVDSDTLRGVHGVRIAKMHVLKQIVALEHDAGVVGEALGCNTIGFRVDASNRRAVAVADLIGIATGARGGHHEDTCVVVAADNDVTHTYILVVVDLGRGSVDGEGWRDHHVAPPRQTWASRPESVIARRCRPTPLPTLRPACFVKLPSHSPQ
jgi:hypothetical protein